MSWPEAIAASVGAICVAAMFIGVIIRGTR